MYSLINICIAVNKEYVSEKSWIYFRKNAGLLSLLWYVVVLTEKEAQPMKNMINELWHGT